MLNGPFTLAALIAGSNKLRAASLLAGLTLLAGCTTGSRAPVVDLSDGLPPAASPAPHAGGSTYVVKRGDTLYHIARATGTSVDSLVNWNNIADPTQLRVGQVLKLTASASAAAPTVTPPPAGQQTPAESQPAQPEAPEQPPATTTPPPQEPPKPVSPPPTQRAADANVINWAWPASGDIIQSFSPATKGIDIAGTSGDPVLAAADGKVMYSGNGVRGLGNLIIINHQSGFITAYAHNRTLLVKTGQEVKRGTKIAEIGQTDTTSPRLHFEVRRQGTPVNPLQYLPAR